MPAINRAPRLDIQSLAQLLNPCMARGIVESLYSVCRWRPLLCARDLGEASENHSHNYQCAAQPDASGGCNDFSLLLLLTWQARQQAAQVVAFAPRSQVLINNHK